MTLGRSSQAQNIAASRYLMFSSSHPSRRKSRIRRLSVILATFDTSISSSVLFSVRCRFARSSSSSVSRGMACQPLLTLRCLKLHLERHLLRQRCQHFERHTLQRHCWHLQHLLLQWRRCDAHEICWSVGELELDSFGGPLACRVPCAAFSLFQPLLALPCSSKEFFHSCTAYR